MNGPNPGTKYIDTIDMDGADYQREQYRPAEVKQDVRQMSERKRVNEILKSKQFRDELEEVVVEKIKCTGPDRASILVLQQISELLLPQARLRHGAVYGRGTSSVPPIMDFKDGTMTNYEKGEKMLRCKLAACYRLIEEYRWTQPERPSYISARVGLEGNNAFLISPGNLSFSTSSATSLIKVDEAGLDGGLAGGRVDGTALILHSATYMANEKIKSVLLIRSSSALLLTTLGYGLLPLSRDAMVLGRVPLVELEEGEDVVVQLVPVFEAADKAVLIKNVGALVFGESIEETFISARKLVSAMETQLKAVPVGVENLYLPPEEMRKKVFMSAVKKQKRNELEFEALMRHLENAGHSTGYAFKESLFRKSEKPDRVNAEVELPPTVVSVGYLDEDKPREKKPASFAEYLNSPNAYKKEEVELGSGTPYNKKIIRWVPESSPAGTLIKIDSPNQFAPVGTNPKELKAKVKQICKEYYDENITAGPQSKVLGGLSWEEAQKIQDKNKTSDTVIMVGSASRGIIQKGHQNQGSLYRTYYAPNPFANVTEEDVDAYKQEIGQKTAEESHIVHYSEDPDQMVPGPDGRLISTEERIKQVKQQQQHLQQPSADESVDAAVTSDNDHEAVEKVRRQMEQQQLNMSNYNSQIQQQSHPMNRGEPHPVVSSLPPHMVKEQGKLPTSPAKSVSSGEGTAPEVVSGTEEKGESEKKKKKKGFRMPSFSKKKDKKENDDQPSRETFWDWQRNLSTVKGI